VILAYQDNLLILNLIVIVRLDILKIPALYNVYNANIPALLVQVQNYHVMNVFLEIIDMINQIVNVKMDFMKTQIKIVYPVNILVKTVHLKTYVLIVKILKIEFYLQMIIQNVIAKTVILIMDLHVNNVITNVNFVWEQVITVKLAQKLLDTEPNVNV